MAWYDPGGGAGVWDAARVEPDLRNIISQLCWAVNEREACKSHSAVSSITRSGTTANVIGVSSVSVGDYVNIIGAVETDYNGFKQVTAVPTLPAVTGITRSGSTATATTASAHGLNVGDRVTVSGCSDALYNGAKTITAVTTTTFDYTVSGTPATPAAGSPAITTTLFFQISVSGSPTTPATGTIRCGKASTSFTYLEDYTQKKWPTASNFDGFPVYKISDPPDLTVTTLGQAGGTASLHFPGIGLQSGHWVNISGANESDYNGDKQVTSVPSARSVTSITRSGATATLTTGATHDLLTGDIAVITGAAQAEYNGVFTITKTGANTLTYTITGTPATPATGTITIQDLSRVYFSIDSGAATTATGTIVAKCPATMIYQGRWSGGTARLYAKNHGFSVGNWVEVVCEATAGSGVDYRFWGPVTGVSANEYFEIAVSATLGSPINITDFTGAFWASRVIGIRKTLREIQSGIEGLLTASTSVGIIRFVEDSSPYETNYTLANLLGAGSYGSSWIDLMGLPIDEVSDAVLQMREALDLLVVTTVTNTGTTQSHNRHTSMSGTVAVSNVSESGGVITVDTSSSHYMLDGETAYFKIENPASPLFSTYEATATVTVVDGDTLDITASFSAGSFSPDPELIVPGYSLENAWDNSVSGSSFSTSSVSTHVSRRNAVNNNRISGIDWGVNQNVVFTEYSADAIYAFTPMAGSFVDGKIYLIESNNGDVTQDAYVLTDSDGDDADIDATLGTTDSLITVSKTSAFFASASKTLTFTTPTPASNPFSSALGDDEDSIRYVNIRTTPSSCQHTRELVPGTHLTYG